MGQILVAMLAGVCSKEGVSYGYGAIGNFSDEVTEGQSNVSIEEERLNDVVES